MPVQAMEYLQHLRPHYAPTWHSLTEAEKFKIKLLLILDINQSCDHTIEFYQRLDKETRALLNQIGAHIDTQLILASH